MSSGRSAVGWLAVLFGFACSLGACHHQATPPDAGKDARSDAPPDVAREVSASTDAPTESAPDAAVEATPDAVAEAAADAPSDLAAEAATDAAVDADPACATIPKEATRTVHLRLTADNECEVFVNGADVGQTTNWGSPVTLDVSLFIYPGRINVIAAMARNTSSQDGNDRGFIGELDDLTDGGSKVVLVTDGTWKSSKTERSGWPATLYDDSDWDAATVVASHGDGPWGALLGTSAAKWLWTAPVPASTADKPDLETAFFRKAFYFGVDGTTIATGPACPQ
ncbi:MAG: hydrolase [Myxococcales bacterium]|nr:hydrolase [Myxococcales bacterium]